MLRGYSDSYFLDNVGIGISTPSEKLDIVGNIKANGNFQTTGVNGQGLRFWDSADEYKIHMSQTSDANWGGQVSGAGASDYNMYFRVTGGTNRGFVWLNYRTPIMQLEKNGNLNVVGNGYFNTIKVKGGSDEQLTIQAPTGRSYSKLKFANLDGNDCSVIHSLIMRGKAVI